MEIVWFCLVAVMVAVYVVLDGYDIGTGIVAPLVAKNDTERRMLLASIGPVWDGNEVWLLAGGGTLYFAFPALYASSFSGFYLPLIIVLWLLMMRGLSIELRNHLNNATWRPFWDTAFFVSSLLLAVFFGAALGNVVRGVPLDKEGHFFLPLWTDFRVSATPGILDWYTILTGVTALATLALHGALWVAMKTPDPVRSRARAIARPLWVAVAVLVALLTVVTFQIQTHIPGNFSQYPWGAIFPILAIAGLVGMFLWMRDPEMETRAFLASCAFILGMLTSVVFGVFPYVLPSNTDPSLSLTVYNASAAEYGLKVGLAWWVPGILLAIGYHVFIYTHFKGKVSPDATGH
jgi:cytochrome d ubiquinol oxidase subunit II